MSIVGTGIGTIGIMGLMVRMLATNVTAGIADLRTDSPGSARRWSRRRAAGSCQLDKTNTRIDAIGRDIAELRDRTGIKPLALIKQASANRSRAAGRKALINRDLCNRLENVDPPYEKFLWYVTW